ncbi:DNA-directed RNA polymerase subunit alpha [Candidatus Gottesmanbacteria bacterium RBG_16_43_7]|uniref:DNA-directed RNA polymerase subunit alpha n=1 Tax=Candidatus Gottesmanbacteria bacterium RBG_16_43_7 TaxID=1798373 RepID=A0A1F5ZB10_9BACT|nr:MAG: DNA-directed RNA polymerase subunit alpha [Candidatus Gottesmanbacteria bacterium RBG_16_43_7]
MMDATFTIKTEIDQSGYGKFIIEPLEQGYGQTLGNSLRRVLLTSLPGAAITSVSIEGIKHQFATIEGLKENIVDLIMNIKKIRLQIEGDEEVTLTISKKGQGVITTDDIEAPAGVTIVNPELVLGTLSDKKSQIEIKMTAAKGFGYEIAADKTAEVVGVIPVDALYSPVSRVNYRIDSTRVGRMTNLDKLVMEIWTDATIKPADALIQAARILVTYFNQIIEPKVVQVEEKDTQEETVSEEVLKTRIEELDIPTRIVNALSNGGIDTIGQLVQTPRSELLKIKNLGAKSVSVVEEKVKEKGVLLVA